MLFQRVNIVYLAAVDEVKIVKTKELDLKPEQKKGVDETLFIESLYTNCSRFYEQQYGFPLIRIPESLLSSPTYKRITVIRAMNIFSLFNLLPREAGLFYHALLLDALPLPPDVLELRNEDSIEYHYHGLVLKDILRPTYFYVRDLLEYLKEKTDQPKKRIDTFKFFDSIGRPFQLDLKKVYADWLASPDNRNILNYTSQPEFIKSMKAMKDAENLISSTNNKFKTKTVSRLNEIMGKSYEVQQTSDYTSSMFSFNTRYERCAYS